MKALTAHSTDDRDCIREFEFSPEDVLEEKNDKILRLSSLLKSVACQAIAGEPVEVYAQGQSSCLKILDVVEAVDEDLVHFKGGYIIPMKAIVKIKTSL